MQTYHNTKRVHRCQDSVNNQVSIHYCNPYENLHDIPNCGCFRWWLLKAEKDWDLDFWYLNPISSITYCPYCGQALD